MRRGEPAKGGKEVGTRGLDVTQETTKSHRERLRQGTSIEPLAYGSYGSGGRFWKTENETMVTKKSLDRLEGPQTGGGGAALGPAKAGTGSEGGAGTPISEAERLTFREFWFWKEPEATIEMTMW